MVSIPGGEPLLHPQIDEIVEGLVERKKYIYLCTNALLLKQKIDLFTPSKYLTFSVHMDGLKEHHDFSVCREGTYRHRHRRHQGGRQTRLPRHHQHHPLRRRRPRSRPRILRRNDGPRRRRHDALARLLLRKSARPAAFPRQGPDPPLFTQNPLEPQENLEIQPSALFLEFLMGHLDFACTPWGMPTYNIFGWQKPCYLLQDGYVNTFKESSKLPNGTTTAPRPATQVANCMVHPATKPPPSMTPSAAPARPPGVHPRHDFPYPPQPGRPRSPRRIPLIPTGCAFPLTVSAKSPPPPPTAGTKPPKSPDMMSRQKGMTG